jgi:hypothetical protein
MQRVQTYLKLCESGPFTADCRLWAVLAGRGGGERVGFTLEVVVGSVEAGGFG